MGSGPHPREARPQAGQVPLRVWDVPALRLCPSSMARPHPIFLPSTLTKRPGPGPAPPWGGPNTRYSGTTLRRCCFF